jgi:cytochrome c-type biogenesis protein CcmH/NrfG/predicted aspartyl protease
MQNNQQNRFSRLTINSIVIVMCAMLWSGVALSVKAAPSSPDKKYSRAERALRDGDYEAAENLFRELLAKNERDNQARLGLSYTLIKQRNLQDAFDHAARVIANDPLSPRAHALLGTALLASGDFKISVEEFRTALSLKGDEALAIAGLGMVAYYENRLGESMKRLRQATVIDPNEPDFVFSLAQAAARSENYKEAADSYERFLAIAPPTDTDRRTRIRGLIDFLRYLGTQNSLYSPGGADHTIVSFSSPDDRPMMLVYLNGEKEPYRFVLDTGSGMSVISDRTAKRLGIKPVARGGLSRAVGGGGRFETVYGFLSSLEIGEARIDRVPVYIRQFYDEKNSVDGYLGLSVITKFLATVDYGAHTFTLTRRSGSSNDIRPLLASELPMHTSGSGFLSGEVRVESVEKPLNFIIDTGASVSVVSQKLFEATNIDSFAQKTKMKIYGAAGVADDVKMLTLPRVTFGAFSRPKIPAAVLDLEPVNETAGFMQDGILGGNFLRYYRVTFDFARAVIQLEPLIPPATPAKGVKTEGTVTEQP